MEGSATTVVKDANACVLSIVEDESDYVNITAMACHMEEGFPEAVACVKGSALVVKGGRGGDVIFSHSSNLVHSISCEAVVRDR